MIDEKKIEVGHGTGLEVVASWAGEKPFNKKYEIWQVFAWTNWAMPMVALADSPLKTYYDLKGKQVSMIKKGSGTFRVVVPNRYGGIWHIRRYQKELSLFLMGPKMLWWTVSSSLFQGTFPDGKPNPAMIDLAAPPIQSPRAGFGGHEKSDRP